MATLTEREKVAHILRRFALGASENELDYYAKDGVKGAIDLLLDQSVADDWDVQPQEFANKQGVINIRIAQGLWYMRLLATKKPLQEKLTLFWHNHFATSASKVANSYAMMRQIDTLRAGCLGSFQDLLTNVAKDPAMLYWLDNNLNVKGKPNENFAREIMELFTLGVGNYSEKDIQEAARAFTGYGYGAGRFAGDDAAPRGRVDRFRFTPEKHDDGEKTVLGKTGNFTGDDVIAIICDKPRCAQFIAHKMWSHFVYENPEPALIDRIAKKFKESGLKIETLVRAILETPEFYSDKAVRKQIKNPVEFAVVTARQLGTGQQITTRIAQARENPQVNEQTGLNVGMVRSLAAGMATLNSTKTMGMELLYPPDVSGWATGTYWISTATMVARMKWADTLFQGGGGTPRQNIGGDVGNRNPSVGIFAMSLFEDRTPKGVVAKLLSVFDATATPDQTKSMEEAASKALANGLTPQSAGIVARDVSRLLFGSPQFQMN